MHRGRLPCQTQLQAAHQLITENAARLGVAGALERGGQRGDEDRAKEERVPGRQGPRVPVALVVDPGGVLEHGELAVFHNQLLKLPVPGKGSQKIGFPPRIRAQNHPPAFLSQDQAVIDHFRQDVIDVVDKGLEP